MTVSVNRSWAQLKRPPQKVVRTAQSVFRASVAGKSYLVANHNRLNFELDIWTDGVPSHVLRGFSVQVWQRGEKEMKGAANSFE